jgi:NAD(P)-dependent dehydrogenase (short-subunit alcohol dehydrogenase family)
VIITSSFNYHSTALEVAARHELHGKHALVTGAPSGIGVETVRALATTGAEVTLAVRNTGAGEEVVETLRHQNAGATLHVLELDLASLSSVRRAVARYVDTARPLRLLINNAGVMSTPLQSTSDGFEMQFGTNHLGHFALATGLIAAREGRSPGVALLERAPAKRLQPRRPQLRASSL